MTGRTITLPCNCADGPHETRAGLTPVPGLVICQDPHHAERWGVCHDPGGEMIAPLPGPEAALHAAVQLGKLGDWSRATPAIQADIGLREAWRDWIEAEGLQRVLQDYPPGPEYAGSGR